MRLFKIFSLLFLFFALFGCNSVNRSFFSEEDCIKPFSRNNSYWQYRSEPVLLLGATDNDNLFQNDNVESHLDSLKDIGGNYIRNTMSDRDTGNLKAFAVNRDGKYDLNRWNVEYWEHFENMLKLAYDRDIIVQIEIWDRFDHSRIPWLTDPYNPKNNINYSYAEAGLDSLYPSHPGMNEQPFFYTVPGLKNNRILLKYQEAFVKKILSISLNYGNVLYCIDNETKGAEEWADYWAEFIRKNSMGKDICITQMWDTWDVKTDIHKRTIDHPEIYRYIDISQNSQITGRQNWDNAQYVFDYIKENPRPMNSTKIYGSDSGSWQDRGINTEHGIQSFCRNIIGGFASSRFHRPPSGLGLSELSINCIKTIRKIEEYIKMWEIKPEMDLLADAEGNQAYLSCRDGDKYLLYLPYGGSVLLKLDNQPGRYWLRWISTADAQWGEASFIEGGKTVELESGYTKNCFGILIKSI